MKNTHIALLIGSAMTTQLYANTDKVQDSAVLDEVIVRGTPFSQQIGTQKLAHAQIRRLPAKDGNITELLRNNPSVRFSNNADTSRAAGEIAPNEVSINGEKFYHNNYTLDGVNNNDNLNPASDNSTKTSDPDGYSPNDLPSGGTQSFWIDNHLLKNVEVFDSNVSAKYGRFTGGVINAQLIEPDLEKFGGKVFYRTTRDSWAEFHLDENEKDRYYKAENLAHQPKFTKQQYGVSASQPLSEKSALLFSYNRSESKIPFYHSFLGEWEKQHRINETYLLKGIYLQDNGDLWRSTVMYSPHRSIYLKKNIKNGSFSNTGGGVFATLQWEKNAEWAKMETTLAYKQTGNEIQHAGQHFDNYSYTGTNTSTRGFCSNANCKSAQSGGYGTYLTEKTIWTAKQDWTFGEFDTLSLAHKFIFGWEVELANAKYQRDHDNYETLYRNDVLRSKGLNPKRRVKVGDNTYAVYLEDSMQWKNLNVNLGVRFDRSEFLGNNNIAPRLSASYDLFGNDKTQLFMGINRYYSGSVLTYKLKNLIGESIDCTIATNQCTYKPGNSFDISNLKTPYSDERVLGIAQKFYDVRTTLKWVHRDSRDQFSRSYKATEIGGVKTYHMTNDGRGENDSFTLSIKPKTAHTFGFVKVEWDIGVQLNKSKTNYSTYDSADFGNNDVSKAIVDGKLVDLDDAPTENYNTPWAAFTNIHFHFPAIRFDWDHRLSYNAGYVSYKTATVNCPGNEVCGNFIGKAKEYKTTKYASHFLWDWRFGYKQPTFQNQYIEISLDVNNVLNRKVVASTGSGSSLSYKMGRNFWLGASYNW